MMKWFLTSFVVVLGTALALPEAEARRFGGARSLGVQRSVPKAPPAAAPAQQQQATQAAGKQAAPATSRWAPMLGGLALGGLLGWLFAGNGLGGVLLIMLLAFAAVMLFRMLARGAERSAQRVQYAGLGQDSAVPPSAAPGAGRAQPALGADAQAFLRAAKANFLKLQLANDAGQWEEIREFTTDEMLAALRAEAPEPGQRTEVLSLEAELLEAATEGGRHWASVRFTGQVRESAAAEPAPFAEVWHLAKPVDGSSGWLLAGIQQMH